MPVVPAAREQKVKAFAALHEGPTFVIPNPWDAGSARVLDGLGFKALATTSGGFAFTLGRQDGAVTLEEVARHVREIDEATALPVSVDLENGYGPAPEDAARAIAAASEAGAAGGSIEDSDPGDGIYPLDFAAERVTAAAEEAARRDFVLTARAENFIRENPDLDDTIARLQAYERAGADVLYAPGLPGIDEIRAVCQAVSKPVNVLARPNLSLDEIAEAGGQRISVGSGLTWVAAKAMLAAAEQMQGGDFSAMTGPGRIKDWLERA